MILLVGSMDMTLLTGGKNGTNPPRELFSGRAVLFLATARTVLEFSVGFSKSLFLVYCTIVADSLGPAFLLEVLTPVCLLVAFCSSLNMGLNLVDPR
jgi:hypothetical protein